MIAIHLTKGSFSDRWINYCQTNNINYKIVDCFRSDIIQQINDCDALMWHFSQNDPKAILFAKGLLYSIELSGKKVFPDFNTVWHFDDKVGQKYLLESINAPLAPVWIFYNKEEALKWSKISKFPKVFKLSGGAGSQNVRLVKSCSSARRLIKKAFGRGFPAYDPVGGMKERWNRYQQMRTDYKDILKGVIRFFYLPPYARVKGREKGYVYFQEFIPGNSFDIRIIVIGDKAFGIKRMVRNNDFRASGSGLVLYEREHFSESTVQLSFQMAQKMKSQCAAFDFVFSGSKNYVIEVSYGFIKEVYDPCTGYWDKNMAWHAGEFNPCEWMVQDLVKSTYVI